MCLTELTVGGKSRVRNMRRLHASVRRRLKDMGFYEGAVVTLSHCLPFGGPVILETNGQSVGIRKQDARQVEVERL
nr:FeoA family protein [Thermicanus aegyptius]